MVSRELDRRHFIQITALGTLGLALLPNRRAEAVGPLLTLLGRFTFAVGASVLADTISDYIKQLRNGSDYGQRIQNVNAQLASQGFRDQRYSTVYSSYTSERRVYYPVVNSSCSCLNFTAPFFRVDCGCIPVTMVQGPHLAGLAFASEILQRKYSKSYAKEILIPQTGLRTSSGTPQRGYDGPVMYHAPEAKVRVDYHPSTSDSGTVVVKAHRHSDGYPVVNDEWDIAFA